MLATPASAHVDAVGEPGADGSTEVTFKFDHGCGTSPTTSLKIELPAGTTDVKPQAVEGFTASVSGSVLSWTGGSVPNETKREFPVSMKLVGEAGAIVFFPTIQGCASGQEDWIEKTSDAGAPHAAPRITLGQGSGTGGGDHGHDADPTSTSTSTPTSTTGASDPVPSTTIAPASTTTPGASAAATNAPTTIAAPPTSESSNTPLLLGFILAVIVVGAIVAGLALRNRSSDRPGPRAGDA